MFKSKKALSSKVGRACRRYVFYKGRSTTGIHSPRLFNTHQKYHLIENRRPPQKLKYQSKETARVGEKKL